MVPKYSYVNNMIQTSSLTDLPSFAREEKPTIRTNIHLRVLIILSKAILRPFANNIEVGPDAIQGQCSCPKTTSTLTPSL